MSESSVPKTALILMGCPEVPVQIAIVMYLVYRLNLMGIETVVAGTGAALNIARVSDPARHYLKKLKGIDRVIADLAEKKSKYDMSFAMAHNDAGISYAATLSALSDVEPYLVIFGRNAESLAQSVDFPAKIIEEVVVHNPIPLKKKIDEVFGWDA